MPSSRLEADAVEITSEQTQLRPLPTIKPKVQIVEDYCDSRDVRGKRRVIPMNGNLPLIDRLELIRRIQKNEARSWGLVRSRAARG